MRRCFARACENRHCSRPCVNTMPSGPSGWFFPSLGEFPHTHALIRYPESLCSSLLSGLSSQELWPPRSPHTVSLSPQPRRLPGSAGPSPVPRPGERPAVGLTLSLSSLSESVVLCFLMSSVLKPIISHPLSGFLLVSSGREHLVPTAPSQADLGVGHWYV